MRGRVWTGRNDAVPFFEDAVLEIEAGRVLGVRSAMSSDDPAALDRTGNPHTFLPGMVDLHNHGGAGQSFPTADAEGCRTAVSYHRSRGTTSMLASLVSADGPSLIAQSTVLAELAEAGVIAGIHLEGPFLSGKRCGAQDPAALTPGDPDLLLDIIRASRGHLRSITIAPETKQYERLVQVCAEHHVVASLGHSDASANETDHALSVAMEAGAVVTATHLFNGMPPMHHRHPGIAGALLGAAARDEVTVELVADGVHLDDSMVGLVLTAARGRVAFVSDAMAAAGMVDGTYNLGTAPVVVHEGVARLAVSDGGEGSIAGGTSSLLDQMIRHAGGVLWTGSWGEQHHRTRWAACVVAACTSTPARALGMKDRGELAAGMRADVVELNSCGELTRVFVAGVDEGSTQRT